MKNMSFFKGDIFCKNKVYNHTNNINLVFNSNENTFINSRPLYENESDNSCDEDSRINIITHSQEDLSSAGLCSFEIQHLLIKSCHCNHHFNKNLSFQNHQQNINDDYSIFEPCLNPFCYFTMSKIPFLPRKLEIEAAQKRKCDCSLHNNETKRFHSRTESLRDILRVRDSYSSSLNSDEPIVNKESFHYFELNSPHTSTSKNKKYSYENSFYKNIKKKSNSHLVANDCNNSCEFHSKNNIGHSSTNILDTRNPTIDIHSSPKSISIDSQYKLQSLNYNYGSHSLKDFHFQSDNIDSAVNPYHQNKNFSGKKKHFSNEKCGTSQTVDDRRRSYPLLNNFMDTEEFIRWLNETEFKTGFIDSHCHIDFLFRKLNFSESFDTFINICKDSEPFPKSFRGCIAVFCDPRSFFKFEWWQILLNNDKIWGAFGCHPHFSTYFGPDEENMLRYALMNEKVVATGEIGLDYSRKNVTNHEKQKIAFERQLGIALEIKKPVVIHCRDAFHDSFEIMKKMLPKNYTVHLHCFTGSFYEASVWMEYFPNLYFGFTPILTQSNKRAMNVKRVVQSLPLNRILLETDSPYFRPFYMEKDKYSHPGMAIHVASAIANLHQISIETVLEETRKNTTNVYNI